MPEKIHTRFEDAPRHAPCVPAKSEDINRTPHGKKRTVRDAFQEATIASAFHLKRHAADLLRTRNALPVAAYKSEICGHLRQKDVLLLIGETGSGKSTQVPQFLVEEPWCKKTPINTAANGSVSNTASHCVKTVGGCIAITEPRRVAAISLARRVAQEMGTPLGKASPASKVGYSVRFDNSTSQSTKIKFLTEGTLLQEMLQDSGLTQYSAVIVDEVHERGITVDLILGLLKKMLAGGCKGDRGGVPLKIVVMSATVNMEGIRGFFEVNKGQPKLSAPFPVTDVSDSTSSEWEGFPDFPCTATCLIEGRQHPVTTIYTPAPVPNIIESAQQAIFNIHVHEALPGDILVFLTGEGPVETLEGLCEETAQSLDLRSVPKLLVLPLFAALSPHAQQRVFEPTPPRTRKVIIATNIAETSVTIPGVRFVIDCGKYKRKHFHREYGYDALLVKLVSKSSADQRKGRGGREGPGTCYRLYTEETFNTFDQDSSPEILRCDLTQMVLGLKAQGIDDVLNFPFLTEPGEESLHQALVRLHLLKVLDDDYKISALGSEVARLPVSPWLGRVLMAAGHPKFDCLEECIDIIAALSVENVFLNNTKSGRKEEADHARQELYRREGDHLTLLATVQGYAAEDVDRKAWCEKRLVSHQAMKAVMDARKQLKTIMSKKATHSQIGAVDYASSQSPDLHSRILQAFVKGCWQSTALRDIDGSYKTLFKKKKVAIHPSSVLYGRNVDAIMYNEFVYTQKAYARGVSAVETGWIREEMRVS